jgi:putative endonuclease
VNFESIRKRLGSLRWPARRLDQRLRLGRRGERAAARHLKAKRHRILARNYRCPAGEIDLICAHRDTIVFVEVKTRADDTAEDPQEALHPTQRRRIENAARSFLAQTSTQNRPCRFDVVTVIWPPRGSPCIEHFEDAFQPARS